MHVPVDDGHALRQTGGLRGTDRDGDVVQKAEAVREVGQAVMAGRAGQGIGVGGLALQDGGEAAVARPADSAAIS